MLVHRVALGLVVMTSFGVAEEIMVMVGEDGMTFTPDTINATVGDEVMFHFAGGTHDVTQGKFDEPCEPVDSGFYSGVVEPEGTFTIPITDNETKWIYCSVSQHCKQGMVGVINPPMSGGNTLSAYREAAAGASEGVAPEEVGGGELGDGMDHEGPASTESPGAATAVSAPDSLMLKAVLGILAAASGWIGVF